MPNLKLAELHESAQTDPGYRSRIRLISALTFVFGLFILWIIYTADTGRANPFIDLIRPIPIGDKVCHAVLYGLLTLGANLSSRCRTFRLGRFAWYRGSLAVAVFALLEELTQIYIPSRAWDGSDLAADAVGIVLFSALSASLWSRVTTNSKDRAISIP